MQMTPAIYTCVGIVLILVATLFPISTPEPELDQTVVEDAPIVMSIGEISRQINEAKSLLRSLRATKDQLQENITITVGQVWEYCTKDTPFAPKECMTYTILEKKAGYVKYSKQYAEFAPVIRSDEIATFIHFYAHDLKTPSTAK